MSGNEEMVAETPPNPRSKASMDAFDALPREFRRFCADYHRAASGQNLMRIYDEAYGDVGQAKRLMRGYLP